MTHMITVSESIPMVDLLHCALCNIDKNPSNNYTQLNSLDIHVIYPWMPQCKPVVQGQL